MATDDSAATDYILIADGHRYVGRIVSTPPPRERPCPGLQGPLNDLATTEIGLSVATHRAKV